jgi:hypothetical protein
MATQNIKPNAWLDFVCVFGAGDQTQDLDMPGKHAALLSYILSSWLKILKENS